MPRYSIRLQSEAAEAMKVEVDRDRAKNQASIDYFRDLLSVLKDGRDEDLGALDSFAASMKMMINRRHDGMAEQIKMQIAREEAHLRDLESGETEELVEADESVANEREHGEGKVTRIKKVANG